MILLLLIPSALYLVATLCLDAHSLLRRRTLYMSLLSGALTALVAYLLLLPMERTSALLIDWGAPVVEELIKLLPILVLARRRRIAFFGDSLIYGTAVGIGFSVVENLLYMKLSALSLSQIFFRSLATSLLHAGCTAMAALCLAQMYRLRSRHGHLVWYSLLAYLVPITLHELYNNLPLFSPNLKFLLLFSLMVALVLGASVHNDRQVQRWLDQSVNSNIRLLSAMRDGQFFTTRQGQLLLQQRDSYSPEDFFDLCCYIEITIELAVIASSRQLLYESGFRQPPDPHQSARTASLLAEHDALRSRISPTALAALRPIIYLHHSDRWILTH